jgi:hypothetical protein
MTEPEPRRFPWGLVLTTLLLAGIALASMKVLPGPRRSASIDVLLTGVAFVVAVFLTMRWLQNYFWGMVAALLLVVHPFDEPGTLSLSHAMRGEAAELLTLTIGVIACGLMYHSRWAWRGWLVLAVLSCVVSGMAWQSTAISGAVSGLLLLIALPPMTVHAWRVRHRPASERLCPGNVFASLALGLLAPVAGLFLGCLPEPMEQGRAEMASPVNLLEQIAPSADWKPLVPFEAQYLERWCWPTPWAVVPLVVGGIWCTVRRGKHDLARRRAPTAWVLTLFALLTLVAAGLRHDGEALAVLSLAALAVLLAVFGVGEVFRSFWDQLRLAPPHERGS